jgi:hypothetical protein
MISHRKFTFRGYPEVNRRQIIKHDNLQEPGPTGLHAEKYPTGQIPTLIFPIKSQQKKRRKPATKVDFNCFKVYISFFTKSTYGT